MTRPDLLPTSHSRHVGRLIISGKNGMPPLRADPFSPPANDDVTSLAVSLLILALLIGGFALLGVAAVMIGRGA